MKNKRLGLGELIALWDLVGWAEEDEYKRKRMKILIKEALNNYADIIISDELAEYIDKDL